VAAAAALGAALGAGAANRVAIVSEQHLGEAWQPGAEASRYVAGYPADATDKSLDVCVTIGYVIGEDGSTSDFAALKTWSSASPEGTPDAKAVDAYVRTAAAVVSLWRYVPAGAKPKPVFTSSTFVFEARPSSASPAAGLRERCRIGDLAAFVAQVRNEAWLKLNRRDSDRMRKPHDMYDRHPDQRLDD
jgi:hypothetical protein